MKIKIKEIVDLVSYLMLHGFGHRGTSDDDDEWRALGRMRFESTYIDEDAIYEQLINEAHGR